MALKDTDTNGTDDAGGESGPTVYNQYGYDDIDRLTTVAYHNSDTEGFVMDDLGNRTGNQTLRGEGTVHFAVDTLTNRYTAVAGNPLAYDDAGNLTQDKDGYRYVYDCENRITRIFKLDGQTEVDVAFYAYDAFGRRICKTSYDSVPSVATLYYYSDNWQVLAEYDGSGGVQAYYVFGNYIDEVLLMHRDTADHYYLHDHLYSPVALLDDDGDVLERCEYDAYGSVQILTSNFSPLTSSQYGNPYAFTGRELDTLDDGSCTLMHYRHRAYNPEIGRFMQQDPHGINPAGGTNNPYYAEKQYLDGMGLYEYILSNPIHYTDPQGLTSIGEILNEFFSFFNRRPDLWVMGTSDPYTRIVRKWEPVKNEISQLKRAVAANESVWKKNHITSPSWIPTMSYSPDPKNGWDNLVKSPLGTDPETARNNFIIYLLTGIQTVELHTSAIGSFRIIATMDPVKNCRVQLNIWMYNEMSRTSFGRFADHPVFRYRPMASQFMWWNWKEEFVIGKGGIPVGIPSNNFGGW